MRYAHLDPERMQRTTDRGGQIIADSCKPENERKVININTAFRG
jgi:hypothetical protein